MEITPSETLYIKNIDDKIKKQPLKKLLYMVFSQYGRVIDIIACKGTKLRGQAWIVYEDVRAATTAIKERQGFNFYGKPLNIAFAKGKSNIVARKEGVLQANAPRQKRQRDDRSDDVDAKRATGEGSNRILFAQNLPPGVTKQSLTTLFQSCTGFVEVRMAAGHDRISFIEFQDSTHASMALRQLNGFKISESAALNLSFSS